MLFGVSVWYQPMVISKKKARTIGQPFVATQKREACLVSGAFRTTGAEDLNTELCLPPIVIHMNRLVKETTVRLRAGPAFAITPTMLRHRRERLVWMDADGSANLEDGRMAASRLPRVLWR